MLCGVVMVCESVSQPRSGALPPDLGFGDADRLPDRVYIPPSRPRSAPIAGDRRSRDTAHKPPQRAERDRQRDGDRDREQQSLISAVLITAVLISAVLISTLEHENSRTRRRVGHSSTTHRGPPSRTGARDPGQVPSETLCRCDDHTAASGTGVPPAAHPTPSI